MRLLITAAIVSIAAIAVPVAQACSTWSCEQTLGGTYRCSCR